MNCIDAVEGTAKATLDRFLDFAAGRRLDASEYIQNVKTVIAGVIRFVENNPEVSDQPELIGDVLYDYAKKLWLAYLEASVDPESEPVPVLDREYQAYCYDYVFDHGNYPR
jgi:glycine cleavage system H lipoate-binding protein